MDWELFWKTPHDSYDRHHGEVWKELIPFLNGKVVDLGCGTCAMYEGTGIDLTGVDSSKEALRQAKIHYPNGKYVLADIVATGLPSGEFDVVIMCGVLDYFDDWEPVLKEARRIGKRVIATLFHGFKNHNWSKYKLLTGHWRMYEE